MADQETAEVRNLRGLLGESIPEGGDPSETMVSEDQLQGWLDANPGNIDGAALSGWKYKMAHWAGLVNVVDGAAARNFSDLMGHAEVMIKMYTKLSAGATSGRARVGRISRSS